MYSSSRCPLRKLAAPYVYHSWDRLNIQQVNYRYKTWHLVTFYRNLLKNQSAKGEPLAYMKLSVYDKCLTILNAWVPSYRLLQRMYVCVLSIVKQPIAIGMGIMNVVTYLNDVCYLQQQVYKLLWWLTVRMLMFLLSGSLHKGMFLIT